MSHTLKKLFLSEKAVAALEFALSLPLLLTLFMGVVETARYAILHQKLDKTVASISDIITRQDTITDTNLNDLKDAAQQIVEPYDLEAHGTLIFTGVINSMTAGEPCITTATPCIAWQYVPTGMSSPGVSRLGFPGDNPVMPEGYVVTINQNVVVTELTYNFEPLLPLTGQIISTLSPHSIYKVSMFKARRGTLAVVNP